MEKKLAALRGALGSTASGAGRRVTAQPKNYVSMGNAQRKASDMSKFKSVRMSRPILNAIKKSPAGQIPSQLRKFL